MNTELMTRENTATTVETTPAAPTLRNPAPGRLAALRQAIATRRARRSELSRTIAAYPATRSAAAIALITERSA